MNKQSKASILIRGIIKENPTLVLVLGTCPTLAITSSVISAIGMGISAMLVLICSNVVISALRNVIPSKVRIPCYIVIIAGFVTLVQMLLQAYLKPLYEMLGVYLALIVVNCIILGRAEMFASSHTVGESAMDGIGMGLGFTLALILMASIREVFGSGTWAGFAIPGAGDYAISILTMAPGGFFVFGLLMALMNKVTHGRSGKKLGCAGCPAAASCGKLGGCEEKEAG